MRWLGWTATLFLICSSAATHAAPGDADLVRALAEEVLLEREAVTLVQQKRLGQAAELLKRDLELERVSNRDVKRAVVEEGGAFWVDVDAVEAKRVEADYHATLRELRKAEPMAPLQATLNALATDTEVQRAFAERLRFKLQGAGFEDDYDEQVTYCGLGAGTDFHLLRMRTGPCGNRACAAHDRCYGTCQTQFGDSKPMVFAPQYQVCDDPLVAALKDCIDQGADMGCRITYGMVLLLMRAVPKIHTSRVPACVLR